jgi:uncharacterized membrane protein (UPF0127 family)
MSKKKSVITLIMGVAVFAGAGLLFLQQTHAEDALKIPPPIHVEPQKPQSSVFYTTPTSDSEFATDEISIDIGEGEKLFFDVELALTPAQQSRGLMFRTEMEDNKGMLFVFNGVKMRSFWMKNTLIPLDMLFIHPDGTIHHIHHNAKPQDLTSITSRYPSKAVLELNGGTADKMGIKEGDKVQHAYFKNVGIDQ